MIMEECRIPIFSSMGVLIMMLCQILIMGFPCEAKVGDGRDGLVYSSNDHHELRDNVVKNLYVINRDLNMLRVERLVDHIEEFEQVPFILHDLLSSNYQEAERKLERLVHRLSICSGSNNLSSSSNYIQEGIIDFSKNALENAKRAQIWTQRLIQYKQNVTTSNIDRQKQLFDSTEKTRLASCFADGTKCQYRACAQGNKLPMCAIGFAAGVTGGASGSYYLVTRSDDNNEKNPAPGTLRHAVEFAGKNKGGAWITFKQSMVIHLREKLWINSHTTIDGRGVNVTIIGKGLVLARVENVILHNFQVVSTGESDTVHVFDGTRQVWIDHLTSRDAYLGLVTVLQGSTDITISNCYLSNHNFNMLLGASDQDTIDQILRVTVYRNWFESSNQRMPHCRWGYCHVANNYYRDWHYYAIGGRAHARIFSERNVFEPGERMEVTPWHDRFTSDLTPTIESSNDLLMHGATFHEFLVYGTLSSPESEFPAYNLPVRSTWEIANLVTKCSGVLFGEKMRECMLSR